MRSITDLVEANECLPLLPKGYRAVGSTKEHPEMNRRGEYLLSVFSEAVPSGCIDQRPTTRDVILMDGKKRLKKPPVTLFQYWGSAISQMRGMRSDGYILAANEETP